MKVLLIIDSLVKGGRERRLIELVKGLHRQAGIRLGLVLFSQRVEYPEIHTFGLPIYYLDRRPKKDPTVFFRFYRICRRERPDIIHSWGIMPSVYAVPTARLLGIKFINACIADAPDDLHWLDRRYLRARATFPFSDLIVANSEAGLRAYQVPPQKARCIYNGFDFSRIEQLDDHPQTRRQFGIPPGTVIGMVGAFFNRKDYDTFFAAAVTLLRARPGLVFLAVGDGPNRKRYQNAVPAALRDRILLPGMVHRVESLVRVFDIGVLTTYTEGISNSIMEYMVLGKPVVATEGGGTRELVLDGETGYLIPGQDVQALVKKLNLLIDDPERRQVLGHNGRKRIELHFSLQRMEREYLAAYRQVLLPKRSKKPPALDQRIDNR